MCGTIRLEAVVVRNLFSMFNVDCVASTKTYTRLTGKEPPDNPPMEFSDGEEADEDIPGLDDTIEDDEMPEDSVNTKDPPDPGDNKDNDNIDVCLDPVWWQPDTTPDDFVPDVVIRARQYPHLPPVFHEPDDDQCDQDQGPVCDICYRTGQPISVVLSHPTYHDNCPTLTQEEKNQVKKMMTGSQVDRFSR